MPARKPQTSETWQGIGNASSGAGVHGRQSGQGSRHSEVVYVFVQERKGLQSQMCALPEFHCLDEQKELLSGSLFSSSVCMQCTCF
mmetsp:Transcript_120990/g.210036  ORF Transcript_120990/g.210036 Transcript_120990/m.210036 type:complete len:86 (+) Transcript_120990:487-744(+)